MGTRTASNARNGWPVDAYSKPEVAVKCHIAIDI